MGRPRKSTPLKFCKACGSEMERKLQPSGQIEGMHSFLRRRFCSLPCYGSSIAKTPQTKADAHTRARQVHRRVSCNRCGEPERLQVHHRDRNPFNNAPVNLETLCLPCHRAEHRRLTPTSICAVCGVSFTARSHRDRNKICSAPCATEFSRTNALKRWYPE